MEIGFLDNLTYKLSSTEDKMHLLEDIAFLLDQDMPSVDIAIDLKKGSGFEKVIGKNMEIAIENSQPLDVVFKPLLSPTTLQTLKAGINNGDTSKGFKEASRALQLNEGLFGKLVFSFIIPVFKIVLVMMAVGFIGQYIFSQLVEIQPYKKWDFFSRFMYEYTGFVAGNWIQIVSGVIAFFVLVWFITTKLVGPPRAFIDKLPFFKQYRILNGGLTLSSLSTLINADEPLLDSVQFLQKNSNFYTRYHLSKIEDNIHKSQGVLGETLDTGMINERDIHRLSRSIPDSEIGDRLLLSAQSHNTILERQISNLQKLTKLIFMVFFIGSLLTLFVSIFMVALSIN
ncbi:hypothetical protein [Vibrio sp. THAF190c]|jgi:type II secretory pathway component PulF|uniref:hypothetical protein n=1 Tax=Vibrio sp. THAF190c TaxID=2587865 RepID=UPI001267E557|nr:hypothetical protein [Vibrio sp. THAF190c]QFT13397.1 Toxin coregulated pilus biosynthesis protein E [Vibrio sp. THAF190c]